MSGNRTQEAFGILLAALGVLFLLVSNNLLPFGWESVWPMVPFLLGIALLRMFAARRKARQLFLGAFLVQVGVFFFLFTSGMLAWGQMAGLWPTFPLIIGISLLAIAGVVETPASALVTGAFFLLSGVFGYLFAFGTVPARLREPVIRVWPLALIGVGVLVYLRARRQGSEVAADPATSSRDRTPSV